MGCFAVLAGLGLARLEAFTPPAWFILGIPICLILAKARSKLSLLIVIFLGLAIGLARGSVYVQQLSLLNNYSMHKVTVEGTVLADSVYGKNSQTTFEISKIHLSYPAQRALAGKFKISGFGIPMAYRGDRVQIIGKLYTYHGGDQASISYAQIKVLSHNTGWLNDWTRRFSAGMHSALPEPIASFALGLLIGQRNDLPSTVTTQLTMVGLVHIIAVSGYNLTILVRAAQKLRLKSKYQRLAMSLCLIAAFVLVTGFSASIIRAAVVSVLGLWAWYYGRALKPLLTIAFAAALTATANPFYVWGDLSWYLSFLAFFGILEVAPLITGRFLKSQPRLLAQVIIETMSAEIMTLPLIMMSFGQLSLIGLAANALIVPLVPWAMMLSAVAGGAGALIPQLAGWLAWPASLLLTYMLDIAHLLSGVPSIFLHLSLSPAMMIYLYVLAGLVIMSLRRRLKNQAVSSAGELAITP